MNQLETHEIFEMEVLNEIRKLKLLPILIFGGGTMLRLCHQLQRYSVDLDFYLKDMDKDFRVAFNNLAKALAVRGFEITDKEIKRKTYLLEMRKAGYPRRLKIEIRKENYQARLVDSVIAYSVFSPDLQVSLTACSLEQMWINKIESLLDRRLIRDAYDVEFLIRRGAGRIADVGREKAALLLSIVEKFKKNDFIHSLRPLLPKEERARLANNKFILLEGALKDRVMKV